MIAGALIHFSIQVVPSCPSVLVSQSGEVFRRDPKQPNVLRARKLYCGQNGYFVVSVKRGEKKAPEYVHRLVAEAFHGPARAGQVIRHLDGNRRNNAAFNVRWGTYTENNHDMVAHGTKAIGQRIHGTKLNEEKVRAIRWLRKQGFRQVDIARAFGTKSRMISDVCLFKCWRYVKDAENERHPRLKSGSILLRED